MGFTLTFLFLGTNFSLLGFWFRAQFKCRPFFWKPFLITQLFSITSCSFYAQYILVLFSCLFTVILHEFMLKSRDLYLSCSPLHPGSGIFPNSRNTCCKNFFIHLGFILLCGMRYKPILIFSTVTDFLKSIYLLSILLPLTWDATSITYLGIYIYLGLMWFFLIYSTDSSTYASFTVLNAVSSSKFQYPMALPPPFIFFLPHLFSIFNIFLDILFISIWIFGNYTITFIY